MSFPRALQEPPRVPLGRLDTPLEPLRRTGERLGLDLWVKRDDLTGAALSGNKVRKLEYLLAEAEARGASPLVTCGGVNSNHARATAVAAARRGARAHLLLRGEDRRPPRGNLLLDRFVGAQVSFIAPDAWADRATRMAELAGADGYVIPEGGSNGLGALGYVRAAAELLRDADRAGVELARVVHACGSGGTTAGLALGFAALGADVEVLSVAVMKDAAHFDPIVRDVLADAVRRGFAPEAMARRARWTIVEGFVGEGYAETTPGEMQALSEVARREGLILDPVYSGKAFFLVSRGALPPTGGATVFLHTGGLFELFAYPEMVDGLA
jgi:D-cysteine desulfhydrase